MSRPRGRPAHGKGVTLDAILSTALAMLDEGEGDGLSLRALAARLGVTPMSLYHHVGDHAGLLRALSDRVYAQALEDAGDAGGAGGACNSARRGKGSSAPPNSSTSGPNSAAAWMPSEAASARTMAMGIGA